jgi:hypothetical protein
MRTETELELEQFVIAQLDGGDRTALRGLSPDFAIRTHSLPDGSHQTVIHHEGLRKTHPADDLAVLDAMDKSELPTKTVAGKVRQVHEGNYRRKERKRIKSECLVCKLDDVVAGMVADGYENAGGVVQGRKIIVYADGLPVQEDI